MDDFFENYLKHLSDDELREAIERRQHYIDSSITDHFHDKGANTKKNLIILQNEQKLRSLKIEIESVDVDGGKASEDQASPSLKKSEGQSAHQSLNG